MEILWEEEGFQFGFKRWQGWAVSEVLWEWIPNVGSKAREGAKAMSLAFVLLEKDVELSSARKYYYYPLPPQFKCSKKDHGLRFNGNFVFTPSQPGR